jgi:hypothetical protein
MIYDSGLVERSNEMKVKQTDVSEPSMEDILASIRRILSEDEVGPFLLYVFDDSEAAFDIKLRWYNAP